MIILGIVLVLLAWLLPQLGVPIPPPIEELFYVGGWILILVGVILWILHLVGRPVGRGIGGRPGRYY